MVLYLALTKLAACPCARIYVLGKAMCLGVFRSKMLLMADVSPYFLLIVSFGLTVSSFLKNHAAMPEVFGSEPAYARLNFLNKVQAFGWSGIGYFLDVLFELQIE